LEAFVDASSLDAFDNSFTNEPAFAFAFALARASSPSSSDGGRLLASCDGWTAGGVLLVVVGLLVVVPTAGMELLLLLTGKAEYAAEFGRGGAMRPSNYLVYEDDDDGY
jgi:hypothetical protein